LSRVYREPMKVENVGTLEQKISVAKMRDFVVSKLEFWGRREERNRRVVFNLNPVYGLCLLFFQIKVFEAMSFVVISKFSNEFAKFVSCRGPSRILGSQQLVVPLVVSIIVSAVISL